jgi:hypothetical protein
MLIIHKLDKDSGRVSRLQPDEFAKEIKNALLSYEGATIAPMDCMIRVLSGGIVQDDNVAYCMPIAREGKSFY